MEEKFNEYFYNEYNNGYREKKDTIDGLMKVCKKMFNEIEELKIEIKKLKKGE